MGGLKLEETQLFSVRLIWQILPTCGGGRGGNQIVDNNNEAVSLLMEEEEPVAAAAVVADDEEKVLPDSRKNGINALAK